jgi:putative ABC transport system permease protein
MDWNTRVREAFRPHAAPDDDVVEELAQHAAAEFEALRADGLDAADAVSRVDARIAAWALEPRSFSRRPRRPPAIVAPAAEAARWAGLWRDVQYALLTIRRRPAAATLVALTLALGVGAATVLVSVAYGVLIKPLPWPSADRLVRVKETRQGSTRKPTYFTNATYLAWADHPATIDAIGAWSTGSRTLTGNGAAERIRIVEATPSLLSMLGVRPAAGRLFTASISGSRDPFEILLSHQLWSRKFGGASDVVGRAIQIDGLPYRVVGVTPRGFGYPDREVEAYVPFMVPPLAAAPGRGGTLSMFGAIARLRPGVTVEQAAAEATARGRAAPDPGLVAMAVFGSRGPVQVSIVPLIDSVVGEVRPALIVFLAAVGLLLAVATANVANLQLARTAARRREFAIRSALGAGAGRLSRQLLVENLVIGQIGGGAGLAVAAAILRALPSIAWADFPRIADVTLDWRTAVVSIGVSVGASMAFGLAPVLQARRLDVVGALAEDGAAPVGAGPRSRAARVRLAIMAGQIAASAVLLVGAVLLGRSFLALVTVDRGFDPANAVTAVVTLPDAAFTPQRRAALLNSLVERLQVLPGVTAAAYSSRIPLVPGLEYLAAFEVPARRGGGMTAAHASVRFVSPGFFEALGLRLREGRGFRRTDSADAQKVVVVNRSFARQYLDSPAVGTRFPPSTGGREVIGVIDDASYGTAGEAPQPEFYECSLQAGSGFEHDEAAIVVRTAGSPAGAASAIRAVVRELDGSAALGPVTMLEDRLWTSLARPRSYAILLGGFAAFAVAVAGIGLFGVLSYTVSLRAREIGIRATLGASPSRIVGLVARQALVVTGCGLAVGLPVAAALGKWVSGLLFGVTPGDPATFVTVGVALALVSVAASVAPAHRAANVDPVKVLR